MIVLDTSVLIDALTGKKLSGGSMRNALAAGERILLPTLVLYEWLRGPRQAEELAAQAALFPAEEAIPFGPQEARVAAEFYRSVGSARHREVDLAIAACAVVRGAFLWTLNPRDFADVPGIRIYRI